MLGRCEIMSLLEKIKGYTLEIMKRYKLEEARSYKADRMKDIN